MPLRPPFPQRAHARAELARQPGLPTPRRRGGLHRRRRGHAGGEPLGGDEYALRPAVILRRGSADPCELRAGAQAPGGADGGGQGRAVAAAGGVCGGVLVGRLVQGAEIPRSPVVVVVIVYRPNRGTGPRLSGFAALSPTYPKCPASGAVASAEHAVRPASSRAHGEPAGSRRSQCRGAGTSSTSAATRLRRGQRCSAPASC